MSKEQNPDRRPIVQDDGWCFVCGPKNPMGLKLAWSIEPDGSARARFLPGKEHQGWSGVVHGGILSALLDEALAQCLRGSDVAAMTARLEVRFRSPLPVARQALVEGRVESQSGRAIRARSTVADAETGRIYAEATGVCLPVRGDWSRLEKGEADGQAGAPAPPERSRERR